MQCPDRFISNYTRSTADNNKVVDCSMLKLAELIRNECDNEDPNSCQRGRAKEGLEDCCNDHLQRYMYGYGDASLPEGCANDENFEREIQELARQSPAEAHIMMNNIQTLYNTCGRTLDARGAPLINLGLYPYPQNLRLPCTPTQVANSDHSGAGAINGYVGDTPVQVRCDAAYTGGGEWTCGADGTFTGTGCTAITCPPTQVSHSDKKDRGSITGVLGATVPVTCDVGYWGGGQWTCSSDDGIRGGAVSFKGEPCSVNGTHCHRVPCALKMRTERWDGYYDFDCNDEIIYCGENIHQQSGSSICSTERRAVSVDLLEGTIGDDLEVCPVGYDRGEIVNQKPTYQTASGTWFEIPGSSEGRIRKCTRLPGWTCDHPCGPNHIYNDKCPGQPLHEAPGITDPEQLRDGP